VIVIDLGAYVLPAVVEDVVPLCEGVHVHPHTCAACGQVMLVAGIECAGLIPRPPCDSCGQNAGWAEKP
jgi:hypothetical protein